MTGAILLLALTRVGMCQTAPVQGVKPASSDTLDEIIVYGQKSLLALRYEIYRAEENFYDLFNSVNSDDEYDIHCDKEAPTGSHIRRRICRANFEKALTAEATSQWLVARQVGMGQSYVHPAARIRHKKKLLIEEMEVLISDHQSCSRLSVDFPMRSRSMSRSIKKSVRVEFSFVGDRGNLAVVTYR